MGPHLVPNPGKWVEFGPGLSPTWIVDNPTPSNLFLLLMAYLRSWEKKGTRYMLCHHVDENITYN